MNITLNQDFEFDIPINEDMGVRGYATETLIKHKNHASEPNTIVMALEAECYSKAMPEFTKKIDLGKYVVSEENFDEIMTEVFNKLQPLIENELGVNLGAMIQEQIAQSQNNL
ncbi:hypothetical protein [Bernardetia sp.]|uniref:hypothetical protein n=1 Tax=Bernardetia sp. TaxID=1937974 RepID=UPI0025BC08D0|nr:hypothetical protein [Bernardetia sp.]